MNRLLTRNPAAVTPQQLPPVARSGGVRILLINSNNLGFSTHAAQLQAATEHRDDVDAVHVDVVHPTWARVLGTTVRPMRGWDLSAWRYLLMYRQIVRRWLRGPLPLDRFDVVQITTQGIGMAIADLKASGVRGTKFAVYVDSTAALEVREFGFPALAAAPMRAAERRIFDAADLVVCMSGWVAASLSGDYGVPPARMFVAPGCVDIPAARPWPPGERRLPRILFVGNDWRRKGGPRLLAMHQEHFADRAELHIVSTGAPDDPSSATARNVVWYGRVPRDRLLGDLMPTMDLLALPTATDMSPWAVLEAAANGLAVVASRVAAIPEMVVDGETGFLPARDDTDGFARAIELLITDRNRCRNMGVAARRHAATHYDPDRVYDGLIDRLKEVAGA